MHRSNNRPVQRKQLQHKLTLQANNLGYQRVDGQTSFTQGKWGMALSGYYAQKQNSFLEFSNFKKATLTARIDYRFSEKTTLSNSLTWLD